VVLRICPTVSIHQSDVANCISVEPGELIRSQFHLKTVTPAVFLQPAFFLLMVTHIPFEGRASKLRYPDYGWSLLSIGEGSAVIAPS